MTNFHLNCMRCNAPVEQRADGTGGYELGFCKWFTTLHSWTEQIIICNSCLDWLLKSLNLDPNRVERITGKSECPDNKDGKHHFIDCDDHPATCLCGKQITE